MKRSNPFPAEEQPATEPITGSASEVAPVEGAGRADDGELTLRIVAVIALLWGALYLVWRIGWTWQGANPVLYAVLLVAEVVGWVSLALYAFLAWRRVPCDPVPVTTVRSVDVLVPTYDEPVEVLQATLLGCAALEHPHRTWLLDDGNRTEMAELARDMGVDYLTRPDNSHAKAGNINHALAHVDGELVAVLDADHVPLPDFLGALVGHFDDPGGAGAGTARVLNLDSVQHTSGEVHEQSLFFRVICPGKERNDSVFWCGSGTVLRRSALMDIGGVCTTTIAEDFHTTIMLHSAAGRPATWTRPCCWASPPRHRFVPVAEESLGPWEPPGHGTRENPFWARRLSPSQRISYLGSLSHYFGGPQRLAMLAVLCVTLLTGLLPLYGRPVLFAVLWAPWVALSLLATKLLGRGHVGPISATRFGWMTMGIYSGAVMGLLLPAVGGFKVTPKGGVDPGGVSVIRRLPTLALSAAVLLSCVVARAAATAGWAELRSMPRFALVATLAIGLFELSVISSVLVSVGGHRQLRSDFRVQVDLAARIGETVVKVSDVTLSGAGLVVDSPRPVGSIFALELRLPALEGPRHDLSLRARVRSCSRAPDGTVRMGVEFVRPSPENVERLIEFSRSRCPPASEEPSKAPAR
ncbi:MAG: glycosyltransferase [Microthrixaceae bacterium]